MTEEESVIFKAAAAAIDCLENEYKEWTGAWKKAAYTQMPPAQPPMLAQPPVDPATGQPMDPAMMGGAAPQGGMPPVDPATGQPMDPSMMGGMPPQGGMPPVDPATGQPMDPAAAGGAPQGGDPAAGGAPQGGDPATQDAIQQLISGVDQLSQTSSDQQARLDQTSSRVRVLEQELDEMKKMISGQAPFDNTQPNANEQQAESLPLPDAQQTQQMLQNS